LAFIAFPLFIRSDAHRFGCASRSAPRLVEMRSTHRDERVCASMVASAFHRAARFTLGAGSGMRHCKQASYEIQPETAEGREQMYPDFCKKLNLVVGGSWPKTLGVLQEAPITLTHWVK